MLVRILSLGGLLGLAAITLPDRGASLMYAWPWSLFYFGAVLAPLLVLVLRAGVSSEPLRLPALPWLGLAGAAAAALGVSAAASPYRGSSVLGIAAPLAGLAAFFLIHDWLQADPANRSRWPVIAALVSGALMLDSFGCWLADVSHLTLDRIFSTTPFDMRNAHPLGHSSYTAGLAVLSLPWLVQAGYGRRGGRRFLAIVAVLVAVLVLFTTGSRGGLLGLAALGVAALATARLGWKRSALLAGVVLVAGVAFAVANPRIRALLGPPDRTAAPNLSDVQRRAMITAGLRMGADRPVLGWGLGATPLAFPRYRAALDSGVENVLQLHCTPVELWAGLGATGLLLLGGFAWLVFRGWAQAPTAAIALAGYGVFALTDFQLDVPVFILAVAALAAQLAATGATAGPRQRLGLTVATLAAAGLVAAFGRADRTPPLNCEALALARDPAQAPRAVALLRESLALNPDQEIAHFNLAWLLLVPEPAEAERHFRAAAQLVPDKGGVYFGLGLARLNQGRLAGAAHAFALECLNDPGFLASPWWKEPAIAAQREATQTAFAGLFERARPALPPGSWVAHQAGLVASLAPRLGLVSPGPESNYRRERTGYPVLMRNHNLTPPVDLFDVREDPRFAASVPFPLPPKGWLPGPLLLKLLDESEPPNHK